MQFERLRLAGFKSFIEPAELVIEPGLTGIVGSNGCGKSNLAEAMRWVMGENSYKTMRAARGEDVIFSGAAARPAANFAEVTLYLDNSDFSAPAAFNFDAELQISRRISRDGFSLYRINGREARAKDVQFLLADQSTGAHSPAQVGQGRVSALIEAKPQARRALLEEAAGIGGLQVRREEAEQKLRATDGNLARLREILADLQQRLAALRQQAASAARFKQFSAEIRRLEAALCRIYRREADALAQKAGQALDKSTQILAESHERQLQAARRLEEAAAALAPLQKEQAEAAAAKQRLKLEYEQREAEQQRAAGRLEELAALLCHIERDSAREADLLAETAAILQKITAEEEQCRAAAGGETKDGDDAALSALAGQCAAAEQALTAVRRQRAEAQAAWAERENIALFYAQAQAELADKAALQSQAVAEAAQNRENAAEAAAETAQKAQHCAVLLQQQEEKLQHLGAQLAEQEKAHALLQSQAAASCAVLQQSQAQSAALADIISSADETAAGKNTAANSVLAQIEVESGYETALSAALGEALQASADKAAALFWRAMPAAAALPLPHAAAALAEFVRAPAFMQPALRQIGLIAPQNGAELQQKLRPGQILVSLEGAMWRWDGFGKQADAPNHFARLLTQRRQWQALQKTLAEAEADYKRRQKMAEQADSARASLAAELNAERQASKNLRQKLEQAQEQAAAAGQRQAAAADKLAYLKEAAADLAAAKADNQRKQAEAAAKRQILPPPAELAAAEARQQADYAALQAELIEKQTERQIRRKQAEALAARCAALAAEKQAWQKRRKTAEQRAAELAARRQAMADEMRELEQGAADCRQQRKTLFAALDKASTHEQALNEALAALDAAQNYAFKEARQAEQALSAAREARSRADERFNAALARQKDNARDNAARLGKIFPPAADNAAEAEAESGDETLSVEELERQCEKNRRERERLGAVNLQAEEENAALQLRYDNLVREEADIAAAQAKLRQAVGDLNREGRARLRAAFEQVNSRFAALFQRLFGGGKAELHWLEAEDPLNIGLEILVCPPGKKLENISLLSGGEQCLTALSLIFAVFLTNPAPICVLDEVDAPLDDYNVERYCRLLRDMTRQTKTRFLVITHNPITMAHMDRLFGVTMAEKGISTLVSVDLQRAAALAEN